MGYQKLQDAIQDNNLSWSEIDRILLNPENYQELQDSASFDLADYATSDAPAVRETTGQEQIIYVAGNGMQVTIEL